MKLKSKLAFFGIALLSLSACKSKIQEELEGQRGLLKRVFISSDALAEVKIVDLSDVGNVKVNAVAVNVNSSSALAYDKQSDALYLLDDEANTLRVFENFANDILVAPGSFDKSLEDTALFANAYSLKLYDNKIFVADSLNGKSRVHVLHENDTSITWLSTHTLDVTVGEFAVYANGYFATEKMNSTIRTFSGLNFSESASVSSSNTVVTELEAAMALHYDIDSDKMFIGDFDETGTGSVHIIANWNNASSDNFISNSEQITISGGSSLLDQPASIDFDGSRGLILIGEQGAGIGALLVYGEPVASRTNLGPAYQITSAGITDIYFR